MAYILLDSFPKQLLDNSGVPRVGAVLKAFEPNTFNSIDFALDSDGNILVDSVITDGAGRLTVNGNIATLYLDQDYKAVLYPDVDNAIANTNPIWTVDEMKLIQGESDNSYDVAIENYILNAGFDPNVTSNFAKVLSEAMISNHYYVDKGANANLIELTRQDLPTPLADYGEIVNYKEGMEIFIRKNLANDNYYHPDDGTDVNLKINNLSQKKVLYREVSYYGAIGTKKRLKPNMLKTASLNRLFYDGTDWIFYVFLKKQDSFVSRDLKIESTSIKDIKISPFMCSCKEFDPVGTPTEGLESNFIITNSAEITVDTTLEFDGITTGVKYNSDVLDINEIYYIFVFSDDLGNTKFMIDKTEYPANAITKLNSVYAENKYIYYKRVGSFNADADSEVTGFTFEHSGNGFYNGYSEPIEDLKAGYNSSGAFPYISDELEDTIVEQELTVPNFNVIVKFTHLLAYAYSVYFISFDATSPPNIHEASYMRGDNGNNGVFDIKAIDAKIKYFINGDGNGAALGISTLGYYDNLTD